MVDKLGAGPPPEMLQEIHVMCINGVALVFLPEEVFCEFGTEIKRRSPFAATVVAGYANDFPAISPARGTSKRRPTPPIWCPKICGNFPFRLDVGTILSDRAVGALETLVITSRQGG